MGDPERYRDQKEVKQWEEHDPIGAFRVQLINAKTATKKVLDDIDARAQMDVLKAVEFAEASPEPEQASLFKDVYVEEV